MSPDYNEGDFVLITKSPFLIKKLSIEDDIVFNHPSLGYLIKRIESVSTNGEVNVKGINPLSIDSRTIGAIENNNILGKVIYKVRRNEKPKQICKSELQSRNK